MTAKMLLGATSLFVNHDLTW